MKKNRRFSTALNVVAIALAYIVIRLALTASGNRSIENLLVQVSFNIIMVVSLNLVTGILGELTLGHAGFMAVGAYTSAIMTSLVFPQSIAYFPLALLIGGFVAALFGYLIGIPALHLNGDYLAIITLGFGEIIRVLINTVFSPWTGGGKKMFNIALYTGFTNTFWIMVICVALIYMLSWSRQGRAIIAIRENEVAADASGVPVTRYKEMAFTIAAFFAGIAGGLYAHSIGVLDPAKFDFNASIDYLVMVVFGGMGSVTGSIIAATGLTLVQFFMAKLVEYRQLAYALLLIVMMIFKPSGLLGVYEFSLTGAITHFFPKFGAFADKMEQKLKRHHANPIPPDVPYYEYDVTNNKPVLETVDLGIRFGGLQAAQGVNIKLSDNEIVGLIGPNGAGKTTVFNMLTGVYQPTEGDVKLLDTYFDREEEGCDQRARELLSVFGMESLADVNANSLSYGQQRKLEICRAMASNPKVLLLDEPAAGMNPIETQELMQTIETIRDRFMVTILLIEHDMKLVMGICERIYVLNYGRIIAEGTPDEIKENKEVITAYLGADNEEKEGA